MTRLPADVWELLYLVDPSVSAFVTLRAVCTSSWRRLSLARWTRNFVKPEEWERRLLPLATRLNTVYIANFDGYTLVTGTRDGATFRGVSGFGKFYTRRAVTRDEPQSGEQAQRDLISRDTTRVDVYDHSVVVQHAIPGYSHYRVVSWGLSVAVEHDVHTDVSWFSSTNAFRSRLPPVPVSTKRHHRLYCLYENCTRFSERRMNMDVYLDHRLRFSRAEIIAVQWGNQRGISIAVDSVRVEVTARP